MVEREHRQIDELNHIFGDKLNAKTILVYRGYFMPSEKARIISREYLGDIIAGVDLVPSHKGHPTETTSTKSKKGLPSQRDCH